MKRPTANRVRELFSYHKLRGELIRRVDIMGGRKHSIAVAHAGDIAGTLTGGYLRVGVDRRVYSAHQLVWLYVTGAWPSSEIDHRDQDPLNNKWRNLRLVTRLMNMQNERRPRKQNKSGFLGVSHSHGKFRAAIRVGGKTVYLGLFDTALAAHRAYVAAKRIHHAGCTL